MSKCSRTSAAVTSSRRLLFQRAAQFTNTSSRPKRCLICAINSRTSLSLLKSGVVADAGIREVAFAGFPEGHPTIDADTMIDALDAKIALAQAQGLGVRVITQFSFAPARILDFCVWLHRRAPNVPVYVGIPGPTSPTALLRFATICGVGASFRAMTNQGMGAVRLLTHTDPGEQLAMVAAHQRGNPHTNIVGVHLFSFGGVAKTAAWMNGVLRG